MSAPSSSPPPPPPGEHLSEMAYDRLQVEPRASDPAFFAAAEAHLAACTACRAAFEALRAHDAGFALEPSWPVRRRARDKRIALHTRIATGLGAAGALAAGLVLATRTDPAPPDPDTVRVRGGALEVALHVEAGNGARRIDDGAVVHPGDRIGFAARTPKAAWLLVFGWDDSGVAYPIFPAGDAARAAPFGPNDTLVPLDVAIALDDVLGREHLAAIVCPHAFTRAAFVADARRVDGAALARAVAADEGCAVRTFTLTKTR